MKQKRIAMTTLALIMTVGIVLLVNSKCFGEPTKLFVKGEQITCLYPGVFSWSNGDQFMKTVEMECEVVKASVAFNDLAPNYQHINVNCIEGLKKRWSYVPGLGMVARHKLNYVKRWMTSDQCFHIQN